jgi:cysteine desulfurase / selenocysteine lyase
LNTPEVAEAAAFAAVRAAEFPRLNGIYLNAAGYGPQPERSLAAIRAFEAQRSAAGLRPEDFGPGLADARDACAGLIGAAADEIALTTNTSTGINIAANILRQRGTQRPVIVLPDGEFPANVYPWLALAHDGFRVERTPVDTNGCPVEDALLERLGRGDVGALAISSVQFSTGFRADLKRLGAACAAHDVLFSVDAIQHVGAAPLDVRHAHVDVLACGGQKWLGAPFGSGFAFIRRELCTRHEPDLPGWLAFESSQDFSRLAECRWDFYDDARRFEVGSLPVQAFIGMTSAARLLLELGTDRIERHIHVLQRPLAEWSRESDGVHMLVADERRRAGILSVRVHDAQAMTARLASHGIQATPREGAIRFAPHLYNTIEEMEHVVSVLRTREG